ncbi:MAG: hypothetical protein JJU22_07055 [Gammaproteobacteria bacterium]|nr:hypothetical protein [Gammaproteobacteria bacterium]
MTELHVGVVLERSGPFSLEELCTICGLPREWVIELVEHGILEPEGRAPEGRPPQGRTPDRWRFSGAAVGRSRRAMRLQRDLELNTEALSLALELLDEVRYLRRRVRDLETLLGR